MLSGLRGDLNIPATLNQRAVTSIRSLAFRDCSELTSVIVPDSIVEIGPAAFLSLLRADLRRPPEDDHRDRKRPVLGVSESAIRHDP